MENEEHIKKVHRDARHERLVQLTRMISEAGDHIGASYAENLEPYLEKARAEESYFIYIITGTEMVEFLLKKLVTVYLHAINFVLVQADENNSDGYIYDLEIDIPNRGSARNVLKDILAKDFKMDKKHPEAYELLLKLINKRNELAHSLIEKYGGNVERINSDLKSYSETKPVEKSIAHILNIQAEIAYDLRKRGGGEPEKKPLIDISKI